MWALPHFVLSDELELKTGVTMTRTSSELLTAGTAACQSEVLPTFSEQNEKWVHEESREF